MEVLKFEGYVEGGIKLALESRSLSYEALSYIWGAVAGESEIICNSFPLLVTANCLTALRHLRKRHKQRILWVDAICINQSSTTERSAQVAMMGEIYRIASRVLLWLGPGSRLTPCVMRDIAWTASDQGYKSENLEGYEHLATLAKKVKHGILTSCSFESSWKSLSTDSNFL